MSTVIDQEPAPVADNRVRPPTLRLLLSELRLFRRDLHTLTFVIAFPVVAMLIIGGSFGTEPDEVFPVNPSHWYVASYFTVVIAATGLIMLPVHTAAYRERGVLRRFAAAGFPRRSFVLAQLCMGLIAIGIGGVVLLAVAYPVYGLPDVHDPLGVVAGIVIGSIAFVSIGILLGTLLPSARAAQAIGLLLFFPSFLLGGGGPPPAVMTDTLADVAAKLPLGIVNDTIREPWLGIGDGTDSLLAAGVIALVALTLAVRRASL